MKNLFCLLPALFLFCGCVTQRISPAFPSQVAVGGPPYLLYSPQIAKKDPSTKRPLVVVLHGCLQSAQDLFEASRMNEEAERAGFFVLYPQQTRAAHPMNCWRWFDRENRKPNSGELALILKMVDEVQAKHAVNPAQIYVTGLSSGGATASALLACHPTRFAGGALIGSPGFGIASDEQNAQLSMASVPTKAAASASKESCSPQSFKGRLLIVAGSRDKTVHPRQAALLTEQFTTTDERKTKRVSSIHLVYPGEYPFQMLCFGPNTRVCTAEVSGLGHAWSGGTLHPFNEPNGPSTSEMIRRMIVENEKPAIVSEPKATKK